MKFKPKDWVLLAIVAVALVVFVYAASRSREGFNDPGVWTEDGGLLETVSITEDGTLWGTQPASMEYKIFRKVNGGSWERVAGSAKQISGRNATEAWCIGTDSGIQKTTDGGKTWAGTGGMGKWVAVGEDGYVLAIGTDEKVQEQTGSAWVIPPFQGMATQVSVGARGVAQVIGGGIIYDLVNGQWQNTGAPSKSVAIAKDGLSVEVSTGDGNVYYKRPGQPYKQFEGATNYIRHISASTTKLACVSTDNKTWTKDISGAAPAAAAPPPAAPPAPTGPSPSAAPGLTAGNYSASCSRCQVVNNQITCACDVQPK